MPSQSERPSRVTNGESHRARALRIIGDQNGTTNGEFAIVHALLAIEERLNALCDATSGGMFDLRRLDADDAREVAAEEYQ